MTAIGPHVVVFWTLSRLVLVRKGCDAAFGPYSQSNMVEQAVTCSCVHQPLGHFACRVQLTTCLTFFGCIPAPRVELELSLGVKVVACWRGDQVTWARRSTRPLVQPCSIGNMGRTLHRSILGPKPVDSASERLQHMGQSRSSVLL